MTNTRNYWNHDNIIE